MNKLTFLICLSMALSICTYVNAEVAKDTQKPVETHKKIEQHPFNQEQMLEIDEDNIMEPFPG